METSGAGGADLAGVAWDLGRLVGRLRTLSAASWRTRRSAVLDLLTALVNLSSRLERVPAHGLPDLPDYSLSDAVSLVGGDCLDCLRRAPDDAALAEVRHAIDRCLARTK